MPTMKKVILAAALWWTAIVPLSRPAAGQTETPKYYFKISNIESRDPKLIPIARELLKAEVESRPEFTTSLPGAQSEDAQIAEIRKQGMKGYQVSLRIVSVKEEIKPPAPGQRDQQMFIHVNLSIFGHTMPGNKMLFTGDGEASLTGEFSERLKDKEEERFMKTAIGSALKQAVSTAAAKVSNATLDDGKGPKGKRGKAGKAKK